MVKMSRVMRDDNKSLEESQVFCHCVFDWKAYSSLKIWREQETVMYEQHHKQCL